MEVKGIIFDMDGVILDSNAPKKNAYFKLILEHNDIIEPIVAEMKKLNRHAVITHILYKIKELKPEAKLEPIEYYFEKYAKLTQGAVKQVPYIDGAQSVLAKLSGKFPLAINT